MTDQEQRDLDDIFSRVNSAMKVMGYPVDSKDPEMMAWVKRARYRMAREMWDPSWRRITQYRSRVYSMLFKKHRQRMGSWSGKSRNTDLCQKLCGCSWQDMRDYIEGMFKEGMTWENHGKKRNQWSLDHITPISTFDWWTDEGLALAFRWDNTQPLWNHEHREKSNRERKLADMRRVTDPEYAMRLLPKTPPPLEGTDREIMAELERQLAKTS